MAMKTLRPKQEVIFDDKDPEHVKAIRGVLLTGKQHPELRFIIEGSFHNAIDMAKHLMAVAYAELILGDIVPDETIINERKEVPAIDSFKVSHTKNYVQLSVVGNDRPGLLS